MALRHVILVVVITTTLLEHAQSSSGGRANRSALRMLCPSSRGGKTACLVNVKMLREQNCVHEDTESIFVGKRTNTATVYCSISLHTGQCTGSFCPVCRRYGRSRDIFKVQFPISHFDHRGVSCVIDCPTTTLRSRTCWLPRSPVAYLISLGRARRRGNTLRMRCHRAIRSIPFNVSCVVNVTQLEEDGCVGGHPEMYDVYEHTVGVVDDNITVCRIYRANHTCARGSLCPFCKTVGADLVHFKIRLSDFHRPSEGYLDASCQVVCAAGLVRSPNKCRITYGSRQVDSVTQTFL